MTPTVFHKAMLWLLIIISYFLAGAAMFGIVLAYISYIRNHPEFHQKKNGQMLRIKLQ